MYADDLSAYAIDSEVQILCDRINTYVPMLLQRTGPGCFSREIHSYSIHRSTKPAHEHPQISINGTIVPLEKQPKILGVTHDTMYTGTFIPHWRIQAAKVRARNNLLKPLAGTSLGQQKETIIPSKH